MKVLAGVALALLAWPRAAPAQEWSYEPRGRRDPFLAPARSGEPSRCEGNGRRGLSVAEVALRGVVTSARGRVAFLVAPDGRSAFVAAGERLCDGEVLRIEADAVVLGQRREAAPTLETRRSLRPE